MEGRNYLQDIYGDFFGVENLNDKAAAFGLKGDDLGNCQVMIRGLFDRINELYVSDDSKELLKKIIEYMRKYDEKIESNYIPFYLLVEVNSDGVREEIEDILLKAGEYFSYLECLDKLSVSLYQGIGQIDFSKAGVIVIHGLGGLNLVSEDDTVKFFYQLEEMLKRNRQVMVMIVGTKEEMGNFFLGREAFREKYFKFLLVGMNPDSQDIYQEVMKRTSVNDDLKILLLDYINATYSSSCDYFTYCNDLIKYISFYKDVPKVEARGSLEEIFSDLNELVGLDKVKKVLYELADVIRFQEKTLDVLTIKNFNLHMVFLGNPGTGKTTIARMVANILYQLKYIKENKVVEVSCRDLVAEFVGQTAPKTMRVIEKSLNGVLFIDEAYTLFDDGNHSYNAEAIATLIQAMENYRDKLVVIFAGYTKEMKKFLDSNSGIASRIGYTLEFDDYTTEELVEIFLGMMKKSGFVVLEEAIDYLKEIINRYRNMKNFGNARFVRNIYEKTVIKHASLVGEEGDSDILRTITKDDISVDNLILE